MRIHKTEADCYVGCPCCGIDMLGLEPCWGVFIDGEPEYYCCSRGCAMEQAAKMTTDMEKRND